MIGVDGIPEMIQAIADSEVDATAFQNPIPEARTALDTCVAAAAHKPVSDNVLPFTLLTRDGAAAALKEVGSVYGQ